MESKNSNAKQSALSLEVRLVVIECNARNVKVKISKSILRGFKFKFFKRHFKIYHNTIFIFQPNTGLEKFFKNMHS